MNSEKDRPAGYILVHESPVKRDMERMKLEAPELYEMMLDNFKDIVSYDFFVEKSNTKMKEYLNYTMLAVISPKNFNGSLKNIILMLVEKTLDT
jgi:hypothetical protein